MTLKAMPQTKRCTRCGEIKEADDFNRRAGHAFSLLPWCCDCKREYDRQKAAEKHKADEAPI